ncbi:MAG: hypothetical protein SFZ24_12055 [Planctomycetota bacterium]|nr:hypothetical protein [Planctomycetota bacterium]
MSETPGMPPWEKNNPKGAGADGESLKLTPEHKARARERAEEAGRPYPNLVDNMREAQEQKSEKASDE